MATTFSYAALTQEDVEDAKRGAPSVSLQPWAAIRGLEYMDRSLPGAFSPILPRFPDYVFNLSRGALPGGRYGYVAHELEEIRADGGGKPSVPGGYVAMHLYGNVSARDFIRPDILDYVEKQRPEKPFADGAFWVPVTAVGVRVPESVLVPAITIRSASRLPWSNPELGAHGLPGYRMAESEHVNDNLQAAIADACRPVETLGAADVRIRIFHGVVSLQRNGYVGDDAALDATVAAAAQIAEAVAAIGWSGLAPQAFVVALPPPDPRTWPAGIPKPERHEIDVLARVSSELRMVQEDPIAYHRIQPRCPVPGWALGVVRGALPGTATDGRVGFFVQGRHTAGTYRSAVMVPARPGAATPVGGVHDAASDLYVEIADGIAYAWPRARSSGALNAAHVVASALPTLQRLGLVDFAPG